MRIHPHRVVPTILVLTPSYSRCVLANCNTTCGYLTCDNLWSVVGAPSTCAYLEAEQGCDCSGCLCPGDVVPCSDQDSDGICDDDDSCPNNALNDPNANGICDCPAASLGFTCDTYQSIFPGAVTCSELEDLGANCTDCNCIWDPCADPSAIDSDGDSICDVLDSCANDAGDDVDSDRMCADEDVCPEDPTNDADSDGICDEDDSCRGDPLNDVDANGLCDGAEETNEIDGILVIVGVVMGSITAVLALVGIIVAAVKGVKTMARRLSQGAVVPLKFDSTSEKDAQGNAAKAKAKPKPGGSNASESKISNVNAHSNSKTKTKMANAWGKKKHSNTAVVPLNGSSGESNTSKHQDEIVPFDDPEESEM